MMKLLSAFISGLLFGVGLIVSKMINPARVQGFLDVFGNWDPTLAFVMGGALCVTIPVMGLLKKKQQPIFDSKFEWPTRTDVDRKLIVGAAMFGAGWGATGFCPGPALVGIGSLSSDVFLFVAAMLAGMFIHKIVSDRQQPVT